MSPLFTPGDLATALFDEPGVGRCIVAADATIARANEDWLRWAGLTSAQAEGSSILELGVYGAAGAVEALFARARAGQRVEIPRLVRRSREEDRYWQVSMVPIGSAGDVALLVTNREVAEATALSLRESAVMLRAISDTSPDVILAKDRDGRMRFANPATLALIGKPAEAVLGQTDAELLVDEESARAVMANDRRIMLSGVAEEVEEAVPLPDGSARLWLSRKIPYRDEEGTVIGLLGISRDITERKRAEVELQKAHEAQRRILASITDGLLVLDRDWRYTYFSETGARILGVRVDDMVGGCVWDLFPHARDSLFGREYQRAVDSGQPVHFDEFYPAPLNRWIECHAYPFEEGLSVFFRDVTDRKEAEEALRAREAQFRTLAESLPMVVARFDRSFRHLYVNGAIKAASGRSPSEIIGKSNEELGMPPENLAVWTPGLRRAFAGESVRLSFTFPAPGGLRSFDAQLLPDRHVDGSVESVLAVVVDVTDRERELRERLELLEAANEARGLLDSIIANAPLGICVLDRTFRYELVNSEMAKINGTPPEAHYGRTPLELLDLPAAELTRAGEAALDGKTYAAEIAGQTPAAPGITRTWQTYWFPVLVAGQTEGVGVIFQEITDRKRLEVARDENDRFREMFIGVLGHDLRNPLSAIVTGASILLQNDAPLATVRVAERIARSANRMARMIDQILDFTRARLAGGIPVSPVATDLRQLLQRVVEEVEQGRRDAVIELVAEGPSEGLWDADRLGQVFSNLIGNAADHGGGSGVRVRLTGGKDVVRVSVTNGGAPIPAEILPHVFEPFRGGRQERNRSGLGLGLFISGQLVQAHGGDIKVTSNDAEGTTFDVALPTTDTLVATEDDGANDHKGARLLPHVGPS